MSRKLIKHILNNGITVLHEPRDLPIVSLSISNKFGAAFEESKIKGIAHVIEHLVFTGTETRSHEDISREIEKKGGILNAFTAHEVTSYWFKMPAEHLMAGLDILTDMLNNSKFDKEKFEKEKRVILEEIKMYHDDPQRNVFEQIEKNMYEAPFGELIIGSKETVSALDRDFVLEYFKKHYSPENFIVTVVGSCNIKEVYKYLEEKFKPSSSQPLKNQNIKLKSAETVEERPGIDQAHFVFGAHVPLPSSPDHYAIEVLNAHLALGMSSRLFLEIREKRGLAYAIKGAVDSEKSYSNYLIYVGTTKPAIAEIKSLILKEIELISKMTKQQLEEAKTELIGLKRVRSEESVNVMNELMFSENAGSAEDYYDYESKINSVSLDQVKSIAKQILKSYSTAAIVPKE